MASNKDLMAEIATLSEQRGVVVPDGLEQFKNARLLEILDGLKAAAPPSVIETPLRPLVAPSPPEDTVTVEAITGPVSPIVGETPPPVLAPDAVAAPPQPIQSATPKPAPSGASGFYVAEGKTVPTLHRDVQGAFEQVYAIDFSDGQAQIDAFIASGYLFKR